MEIPGKGMNTSLALRTKRWNKKQKSRFVIIGNNNQYFRKLLKKFNNSPYLGYKNKQVHNEPTEAYPFLIKHISKLIKSYSHVQPNFVKLDVNETIGHVNEAIRHVDESIQSN